MQTIFCLIIAVGTVFFIRSAEAQISPIITTNSGPVRGKLVRVADSLSVYHFTAIPFAEPPVGQLRFRKTVPKKPWTNTWDATTQANACTQYTNTPISEDCLYLSIWVPKTVLDDAVNGGQFIKGQTSVYNYIYGGGFTGGAIAHNDATMIAAYNNVIVTMPQYRLGSLGFGYLGTEEVPGNMALWDQLEGMKWIYSNIHYFGGNKSEITLVGESAGAYSVTLHMLSPHSRRYFQKAIVQSGSATSPRAYHPPETALMVTNKAFDNLCGGTKSMSEKLACLRSKDAMDFRNSGVPGNLVYANIFLPVIDGDFLPRDPRKLLMEGDVSKIPLLLGVNKNEGTGFVRWTDLGRQLLPDDKNPNRFDALSYQNYTAFIADRYKFLSGGSQLVHQAIELHYWPRSHEGEPKGVEVWQAISDADGDYGFGCPSYEWVRELAKTVPNVYAYFFTHRYSRHGEPEWMGVTHAQDLQFTFGQPFRGGNSYTPEEYTFSKHVMAYWVNFVKYGNPNGNNGSGDLKLRYWPQFVSDSCKESFFELSAKTLVTNVGQPATICGLKKRECRFWRDFMFKEIDAVKKRSY